MYLDTVFKKQLKFDLNPAPSNFEHDSLFFLSLNGP